MSSIILSTQLLETTSDTQEVDINLVVGDEDWVGYFNRLQVFRSTSGESGPFEEITSDVWSPPRIPKSGGDQPSSPVTGQLVNIVGKELSLVVGLDPLTVTFTGSDPLTYAQVASQITAQSSARLVSYVDSSGIVVLEGVYPGLDSRLSVLESEAAIILGLPFEGPDSTATGKDPRLALVPGQSSYSLRDTFGSRDYFYRSRFLNAVTGGQSEASVSHSPKNAVGLAVSSIIIGYADLVDVAGKAIEGAEVSLHNEYSGALIAGKLVTGRTTVEYTDESGHVEFHVVRGQRVTVSVQGTNIVRTITVPTDPAVDTFSLFDPAIADDDVFKVAVPELITAERRTL